MPKVNFIQLRSLDLRVGELVEVRSREEILATLDEPGRLENLPSMPEMLQHCGQRMRVYKRATDTPSLSAAQTLKPVKNAEND